MARPFQLSPSRGADTPFHLATAPELGAVTGGYFRARCRGQPSALGTDPHAAKRLWDLSTELAAAALDAGSRRNLETTEEP